MLDFLLPSSVTSIFNNIVNNYVIQPLGCEVILNKTIYLFSVKIPCLKDLGNFMYNRLNLLILNYEIFSPLSFSCELFFKKSILG